jgi:hypothetical protein
MNTKEMRVVVDRSRLILNGFRAHDGKKYSVLGYLALAHGLNFHPYKPKRNLLIDRYLEFKYGRWFCIGVILIGSRLQFQSIQEDDTNPYWVHRYFLREQEERRLINLFAQRGLELEFVGDYYEQRLQA